MYKRQVLERRLANEGFLRVHRSFLVNIDDVRDVEEMCIRDSLITYFGGCEPHFRDWSIWAVSGKSGTAARCV